MEVRQSMSFQDTMKAISDPTRRKILDMLKEGPMSAGDIGEQFDMAGASISHHLNLLKQANLVLDEKKGKYIYYELNTTVIDDVIVWFQNLKN